MVTLGPRGTSARTDRGSADLPVDRLRRVPLVPRHGARVVRGRRDGAFLNANFVPIKVDREERPDLDAIYMDAVQAMTGQGGWPLSAFLTPDGQPFFAGTYFPKEAIHGTPSFRQVLEAIAEAWRDRRDDVERQGGQVVEAISRTVSGSVRGTAHRRDQLRARWPSSGLRSTGDGEASARPRSSRSP